MGERDNKREGIGITARDLVRSGHYKTQAEAEQRVRRAVVTVEKQNEESNR